MSIQLTDGTTGVLVDPTSSGLLVQNPKVATQAGYTMQTALIDAGVVTGSALHRQSDVTASSRLEVSQPTPLFTDAFNYTAQDTGRWAVTSATFSQTYSGGFLTINSGNAVATGNYALIRSWASWPLPTEGSIVYRMTGMLTQVPQANCTVEIGMFYAVAVAAPTDGVFFRYDSTGTLRCVTNFNGTEISSAAITAPTASIVHDFMIVMSSDTAEFWIDGVLQAIVNSGAGVGSCMITPCVQIAARMYHAAGSTPAIANQLKIASFDLWQTDGNINRPVQFQKAGAGMNAIQGVSGMTMGSTATYVNNTNPTAAVPTNTTAALGTGLGGQFWETATLAVNTDGIISSYQVPAGTVSIASRRLVITGMRWRSMVQTVLAGGPFVYQHGLSVGSTVLSQATGDAAAQKSPRRLAMGLSSFPAAAAVGTAGCDIVHKFNTPLVVNAGEFVQTFVKNIGTVGTSGTIAHSIMFEAHWE